MANFIHRWMNPHCEHCHDEMMDSKVCNSCETLKLEIERLRLENDKLLSALLDKPKIEEKEVDLSNLKPILPKGGMSWKVRQQMLEAEDRNKARLMREAPRPEVSHNDPLAQNNFNSINEIEKELGVNESA